MKTVKPFVVGSIALCLLACSFCQVSAAADDVKTVTRKFALPAAPEKELPKKTSAEKAYNKWSIKVWWDRQMIKLGTFANSGFDSVLATPEVIAALSREKAKAQLMNETEAQELYRDKLSQYFGVDSGDGFGSKITFLGNIQLNTNQYQIGSSDADWQFYLFTEDGKRYKPVKVTLGDVQVQKGGDLFREKPNSWTRTIAITFDNADPETKKPIFSAGTHTLIFAVASTPGQGKAKYEFDPKKK